MFAFVHRTLIFSLALFSAVALSFPAQAQNVSYLSPELEAHMRAILEQLPEEAYGRRGCLRLPMKSTHHGLVYRDFRGSVTNGYDCADQALQVYNYFHARGYEVRIHTITDVEGADELGFWLSHTFLTVKDRGEWVAFDFTPPYRDVQFLRPLRHLARQHAKEEIWDQLTMDNQRMIFSSLVTMGLVPYRYTQAPRESRYGGFLTLVGINNSASLGYIQRAGWQSTRLGVLSDTGIDIGEEIYEFAAQIMAVPSNYYIDPDAAHATPAENRRNFLDEFVFSVAVSMDSFAQWQTSQDALPDKLGFNPYRGDYSDEELATYFDLLVLEGVFIPIGAVGNPRLLFESGKSDEMKAALVLQSSNVLNHVDAMPSQMNLRSVTAALPSIDSEPFNDFLKTYEWAEISGHVDVTLPSETATTEVEAKKAELKQRVLSLMAKSPTIYWPLALPIVLQKDMALESLKELLDIPEEDTP